MKKAEEGKKKLEVRKEKVRPLTDEDLDNAAGGMGSAVCLSSGIKGSIGPVTSRGGQPGSGGLVLSTGVVQQSVVGSTVIPSR